MPFVVIPALDVAGGRLVRVRGSGSEPCDAFGADPEAAAEAFVAQGARMLHFVDVDRAHSGRAANLEILRRVSALGVPVQSSGGIRTMRSLREVLDAGSDRAVIGSAALADPNLIDALIAEASDHVVFGLEVDGGRIRPRGAAEVDMSLSEAANWLAGLGAPRFLVTAVARVGAMAGPDLEAVEQAVGSGVPVIAAGGISAIQELSALESLGAQGAVVGRAAMEGTIDLVAALALGD